MAKIKKVNYFTEDKVQLINHKNIELYERYLKSNILKNKEVEGTTYEIYENYMRQFLVYLAEEWNNVGLYDEYFFKNAIDIIEGFMSFCQNTLENHKKVINTKVSTISSFYIWSVKRREIDFHPFQGKVTRMKGANDERITKDYFLTEEQIELISKELDINTKYDIIDKILFHLSLDSGNRIGAISKLTLSSLDIENGLFENIREKRGYRIEVVFDDKCKTYIEEWLEMRKDMDDLKIDALFISKYGKEYKQMSQGALQYRARKLGKIIGIEDFHMHCFRKSSIDRVMKLSNDIELAKAHANHKSTDTTLLYIKPKSKTEIREKLKELKSLKHKQE